MARTLLVGLLVAAFSLGLPSAGISGGMGKEGASSGASMEGAVQGTVTNVEGKQVTIRDAECNEQTILAGTSEEAEYIRVGDHVSWKEGKLTKAQPGEYGKPFPGEAC